MNHTSLVTPARLQSLLQAAYHANAADSLISPMGDDSYSTLFGVIPAALAVLRVAAEVEPDPVEVMEWYRTTPIRELGGLCAEQLVALGRVEMVIGFLRAIGREDG